MKNKYLLLFFIILSGCTGREESNLTPLEKEILINQKSFFFINVDDYSVEGNLPIGIFDSGTGGLTVMEAIANYDNYNNLSKNSGADGQRDFNSESFIYLGDKANMPYGEYAGKNKTELLKEHIIKDVQFLLGDKYYNSASDSIPKNDKENVKAIIIACNTATAYGKSEIERFLNKAGLDIKVIGVVGAGARGGVIRNLRG